MNPSQIEVTIDELVLHGFPPGDRHRISEAVQRELAHLISTNDINSINRQISVSRVNGGAFIAHPNAHSRTIGKQIANRVFQQIAPAAEASIGGPKS